MQNFQEILMAELQKPASYKAKDEMGNTITKQINPMEAMVKSVMTNAMKGDLASISFINMMTRTNDPEKERQAQELHKQRVKEITERLKIQLEKEKSYDGQDLEIESVAEIAALLERLNDMMADPDFQVVSTDIKNGHQTVSPIIALRDKQRDLFNQQLGKLREEAMRRIITRKNMNL